MNYHPNLWQPQDVIFLITYCLAKTTMPTKNKIQADCISLKCKLVLLYFSTSIYLSNVNHSYAITFKAFQWLSSFSQSEEHKKLNQFLHFCPSFRQILRTIKAVTLNQRKIGRVSRQRRKPSRDSFRTHHFSMHCFELKRKCSGKFGNSDKPI